MLCSTVASEYFPPNSKLLLPFDKLQILKGSCSDGGTLHVIELALRGRLLDALQPLDSSIERGPILDARARPASCSGCITERSKDPG